MENHIVDRLFPVQKKTWSEVACTETPSFLRFQNVPPDLSLCVFVIEQALSVRALQELMASGAEEGAGGGGGGLGSGHKTLLYGNAILLRHANSNMVGGEMTNDVLSGVMVYARCLCKCYRIFERGKGQVAVNYIAENTQLSTFLTRHLKLDNAYALEDILLACRVCC